MLGGSVCDSEEELNGRNVVLRCVARIGLLTSSDARRVLEARVEGAQFCAHGQKSLQVMRVNDELKAAFADNEAGLFVITADSYAGELVRNLSDLYIITET